MDTVGERLRLARKRSGLTLGQLLEYEGISKGHLSEMEHGIKAPTAAVIARLARRYKTSTDYLLVLTDDPEPAVETEDDNDALNDEQRRMLQEAIDALSSLSPRDQRTALDILRVMRKSEDDTDAPMVPRVVE